MQPHSQNMLPNGAILQSMSIQELMDATLRLSDVLTEETNFIRARRFADAAKLHEEKLRLSGLLETYQAVLATKPDFIRNADEKTREELLYLTDDLAVSVRENFHEVAVVKAVNGRVLQAMMDVMSEQQRPSTYGAYGQSLQASNLALSMNLNQKA
jgi:flagellar biosynthesis/type III secretory pathway chaperone